MEQIEKNKTTSQDKFVKKHNQNWHFKSDSKNDDDKKEIEHMNSKRIETRY